jgi:hypothetical protein
MKILGKEISCGCDSRKEIMFGHVRPQDATVLIVVSLLMFAAWRVKSHA